MGESGWDTTGQLNGIVTEFITKDKTQYIYASLHGGQVENDHFPFYEFLFIKVGNNYKLIKEHRYYTDIAGIEGLDYPNIAPIFSSILTVLGLFISVIIALVTWVVNTIKKRKKVSSLL